MCQLKHPNVLTPIGVCVDVEVPYLIMPLMERGSLLMYLRKEKNKLFMPEDTDIDQVNPPHIVSLLNFWIQLACCMYRS